MHLDVAVLCAVCGLRKGQQAALAIATVSIVSQQRASAAVMARTQTSIAHCRT
jgi:hypothetical protein